MSRGRNSSPGRGREGGPHKNTSSRKRGKYSGDMKSIDLKLSDLLQNSVKELHVKAKKLNLTKFSQMKKTVLCLSILKEEARLAGQHFSGGTLEILGEGYGFLRTNSYMLDQSDVYVSPSQIRRFGLRTGDAVVGYVRPPRDNESYHALLRIEAVNYDTPETSSKRPSFESLTPLFPLEKFNLEPSNGDVSPRIIDLLSPVGKGQRGLIVSPPKAGKTTLLKKIANAIAENHPEVEILVLLIDERPEEVTDIERSVKGEVVSSTFDKKITHHIQVSEMVIEKAKRMVENGKDVIILLDSITRLSRAYNIDTPNTGQTLTGGVNPHALYRPKKFFGAARNIEDGGSLTILATALVDTGSRMDEIIFEEFKGTGNMELVLDRELFNKRIYPSIDIKKTGTRKEELLLDPETLKKVWILRRVFSTLPNHEAMTLLIERMKKTKCNRDFLKTVSSSI